MNRVSKTRTRQVRLLCATDLTPRSSRALKAAAALADRAGGKLTLVHVVPRSQSKKTAALTRERLQRQLSRYTPSASSAPAMAIRVGEPAKMITKVARKTGTDLIVMGAQRKRVLSTFRGTTAERVVALARSPLLVIRSRAALRYDRVIVAAADLRDPLDRMLRLADRWDFLDDTRVSVVHGFQSPYQGPRYAEGYDIAKAREEIARWKQSARAQLLRKLSAAGLDDSRIELRIEEKPPLRMVRKAILPGKACLLVLGTSKHTALSRVARGSLLTDALLRLDCDVLICATHARRAVRY